MKLQIAKRLKAMISRHPGESIRNIGGDLIVLRDELKDIERQMDKDALVALVYFFGIVSPWHDRGLQEIILEFESVNYGQHDEMLKDLNTLALHFRKAGRDQYGWNRTERGEMVTDDKVYLGNIFGLFTQPVAYWRTLDHNEPRNPNKWAHTIWEDYTRGRNTRDVLSDQAREFMRSHIEGMLPLLNSVIRRTSRAKAA